MCIAVQIQHRAARHLEYDDIGDAVFVYVVRIIYVFGSRAVDVTYIRFVKVRGDCFGDTG